MVRFSSAVYTQFLCLEIVLEYSQIAMEIMKFIDFTTASEEIDGASLFELQ